jgi:hypothetical protein
MIKMDLLKHAEGIAYRMALAWWAGNALLFKEIRLEECRARQFCLLGLKRTMFWENNSWASASLFAAKTNLCN